MVRAGDSGLAPESLTGEVICHLGLVSLCIKGKPCGQLLALSKKQLTLGTGVPGGSASAQDTEAAKIKNTRVQFIHAGLGRTGEAT